MLDKLMNKLGYIHESKIRDIDSEPLTEDEVFALSADVLIDQYGENIEKKEEKKLFEKLAENEDFMPYLRATAANDIRRFFQATDPRQQLETRGAYARTIYFKSLLAGKKNKAPTKLAGKRYAR